MSNPLDDIHIEPATVEDAFVLAGLTLRWDLERGATGRAGFIDEYAQAWIAQRATHPAWLARRGDGDPVALVVGVLATSMPSLRRPTGGWLHLSAFYVAPELRAHGLGGRMMQQVLQWATRHGLHRVQLNALDEARGFYRRAGFGAPQDTLMQLVLDGAPNDAAAYLTGSTRNTGI